MITDGQLPAHEGPWRVFISHTGELARYPTEADSYVAVAERAVINARHAPRRMAQFGNPHVTPTEIDRDELAACHVYVGLLGFAWGTASVTDAERSYTEEEYDIAGDLERPRRIFVLNETSITLGLPAVAIAVAEDDRQRQTQFRGRVATRLVKMVDNPEQLYTAVLGALGDLHVAVLRRRITELEAELAEAAPHQQDAIAATIAYDREEIELADEQRAAPDLTTTTDTVSVIDVARYRPQRFVGREDELASLDELWHREPGPSKVNVACVVALGGEGKTALVATWLEMLAARQWDGATWAFAWSFYSQGTREPGSASSDLFLSAALRFFGDDATADSSLGPYEKGQRLAALVAERRGLLVLDGLEPLQHSPVHPQAYRLADPGVAGLLRGLAQRNPGLCVVTTRYRVADLAGQVGSTVHERELASLSPAAGRELLRSFRLHGPESAFTDAVARVQGHALALTVIGSYTRDALNGDLGAPAALDLGRADLDSSDGHAFRAIERYATWLGADPAGERALAVLRVAGLFDRPVAAGVFEALVVEPAIEGVTGPLVGLDELARADVLSRLERARLVTVEWGGTGRLVGFDAHPLVREFFASRLRAGNPLGWRAAHGRAYEHLCSTTVEGTDPSFEALAPLYQAIVHGCHADRHQAARDDVYRDRICQRNRFYSTKMLGAVAADLGAVACFFTHPWDTVHPDLTPPTRSWLLNDAGMRLQLLGR